MKSVSEHDIIIYCSINRPHESLLQEDRSLFPGKTIAKILAKIFTIYFTSYGFKNTKNTYTVNCVCVCVFKRKLRTTLLIFYNIIQTNNTKIIQFFF